MTFHMNKSVTAAALAVGGLLTMQAQSSKTTERLEVLVEASARRLAIADQVALAKWDNGKPIEDAPREASVIAGAVKSAEAKGLDSGSMTDFFKAQIEANKVVQYELLARWRRAGGPPPHGPIDLVSAIRPQLDTLQIELITALAETKEIRSGSSCKDEIAKAVGKYLALQKQSEESLHAIALDRALAATCTQ